MSHVHQYKRVNIGHSKPYWVMKCVDPQCPHYTPMKTKLSAPLLRGKMAECSRCHENFILNKRSLRMENPCCDSCVKRKVSKERKSSEEFFAELQKELMK